MHRFICTLALSLVLVACGNNAEKAAMQQMVQGCLGSGAPEKVCTCIYEDPGIVKSAIRLSENRTNEEARLTFTSKLQITVASCVQSELGIKPDMSHSEEEQRLLEQLIPRQ